MQVEKRDGTQERRIIIGMIVDRNVLGRIAPIWTEHGLFRSRWTNLVGTWCVEFYRRYKKAPRKAIEALFETWSMENRDEETSKIVNQFLDGLSGEYAALRKESNSELVLDEANEHFNRVKLEKLKEQLENDLEVGKVKRARRRVETFDQVSVRVSTGIDVLQDEEAIRAAFEAKRHPLIKYPGALGNFFQDFLCRDSLISLEGPEKRGKTWWLMDMAWRAMLQGRRVAFFEIGDLSEGQIMLRYMTRAARRPLQRTTADRPIRYPTDIEHNPQADLAAVHHEEMFWDDDLSWKEALRACKKIITKKNMEEPLLKLSCHPNDTASIADMEGIIDSWDRSGWGLPDVVVIDYADLIVPPPGFTESRDKIDATWKAMRRLSQQLHCLVLTATQSDAESYTVNTIRMGNFSGDKRKNAHVNGMVGLNQTEAEKRMGVTRLNWAPLREGDFSEDQCVHVAGCLGLANPAILSIW